MPATYDRIGSSYARTRRADPGIVDAIAAELALAPTGRYLDLGCGTGNYTAALAARGGVWTAVDVSAVMLNQARGKAQEIDWLQASAASLPLADRAFDGAICTLAIHHFLGLDAPFAEVRRCLRGGCFVIFTGLAEQMRNYWLGHYFPQMMARSIEAMPCEAAILRSLSRAGFDSITVRPFFVTNELQDLFLYSGKHRPELYLDAEVRRNISSFATLAPPGEIEHGLERLAADLCTGTFEAIRTRHKDRRGDYALIVARIGT